MRLSIIVPCFNIDKYVARCLDSILAQDCDKSLYEIIIVNDGSTDGTPAIVEKYAVENENVTLINQPNKGLSAARNAAIEKSLGEYLMFVDGDDYLAPYALNKLLKVLDTNDAELMFFQFVYNNVPTSLTPYSPTEDYVTFLGTGQEYITSMSMKDSVWRYLCRKSLATDNGITFAEGHMYEDGHYTYSLLIHAEHVVATNIITYCHCIRPGSIIQCKETSHLLRLIDDCFYYREAFIQLAQNPGVEITETIRNTIIARGNTYLCTAAQNAIKCNRLKEYYKKLREAGCLPIGPMRKESLPGKKNSLLALLINHPTLLTFICKFERGRRLFYW